MFVSLWQEFKRQVTRTAKLPWFQARGNDGLTDAERDAFTASYLEKIKPRTRSVSLSSKGMVPVVTKAMKHVHNHPDHEVFLYVPSEGRPYWGCRTCQFDEGEIIMTDPTS